jgi:hypothetical protein
MTPEQLYASVVESVVGEPNVSYADETQPKNRFGSGALTIDGHIFAMLSRGRLVVKLPRRRVDELVASGDGERFDPGHGRIMKEWLSLNPASHQEWLPLARAAMEFVGSRRP